MKNCLNQYRRFTLGLFIGILCQAAIAQDSLTCEQLNHRTESALYAGDLATAQQLGERALRQCNAVYDSGHVESIKAQINWAGVKYYEGKREEALNNYQGAKRRLEAITEKNGDLYGSLLINIGSMFNEFDKPLDAARHFDEGLYWLEKSGEGKSLNAGNGFSGWGNASLALSDLEKADSLFRLAITILGKTDTVGFSLIAAKFNYSALLLEMGKADSSLTLLTEVLDWQKANLGEYHFSLPSLYNQKGALLRRLKQFREAGEAFQAGINVVEKNGTTADRIYTILIHGLINVSFDLNDIPRADSLLDRMEQLVSANKQSRLYGHYLNARGLLCRKKNELSQAVSYYEAALAAHESRTGKRLEPERSGILANLGGVLSALGRYEESAVRYEEARRISEDIYGKASNDYAFYTSDQAWLYDLSGQPEKALPLYAEAESAFLNIVKRQLGILSEIDREDFITSYQHYLDLFWSFALKAKNASPEAVDFALNTAWHWKGQLLTSAREFQRSVRESGDPALTATYQQWQDDRKIYDRQILLPAPARKYNMDSLAAKIARLESALALKTNAFSKMKGETPDWKTVVSKLQPDEAIVEFIHFKFKSNTWTDSVLYCALVAKPDWQHAVMVPLCEENQLREWIAYKGSTTLQTINEWYKAPLYDIVWAPLDSLLTGIKTIWYTPDGLLNLIAFGAIPNRQGQPLAEQYNFMAVQSGKEAGMMTDKLTIDYIENPVFFGNIDYDAACDDLPRIERGNQNHNTPVNSIHRGITRDGLSKLPNTKKEIEDAAAWFKKKRKSVTLWEGAQASEERFKWYGLKKSAPRLLHVATHAFWQNPTPGDTLSPLLRCGLYFAGANRFIKGDSLCKDKEEGIVTGAEISDLDFQNTQLVVLSACETGLGDIKAGEGNYGLQRAFRLAGARHLIISLWKVDDPATQQFMTAFYRFWDAEGNIRTAFNKAQSELRNKPPNPDARSPYYWAAFVLY